MFLPHYVAKKKSDVAILNPRLFQLSGRLPQQVYPTQSSSFVIGDKLTP